MPEYHLFLNRNFANVNENLISVKDDALVVNDSVYEKVNFYSTLEDILAYARTYSNTSKITNELIKSDMCGYRPVSSRKKMEKCSLGLRKMIEQIKTSSKDTHPYRLEVGICPNNMLTALDSLEAHLKYSSLLAYNSSELLTVYTITHFNCLI